VLIVLHASSPTLISLQIFERITDAVFSAQFLFATEV